MLDSAEQIRTLFNSLSEVLEAEGSTHIGLIVCGGAALQIMGFVKRTTQDIDIVAFVHNGEDIYPEPIPEQMQHAILRVAQDYELPDDWLNTGPKASQQLGLPEGLLQRASLEEYGKVLKVWYLSRYDQIHFKFYAVVDSGGPGKHLNDLMALQPQSDEIEAAALWTLTHDTSEGYQMMLLQALRALGFSDVADKIG